MLKLIALTATIVVAGCASNPYRYEESEAERLSREYLEDRQGKGSWVKQCVDEGRCPPIPEGGGSGAAINYSFDPSLPYPSTPRVRTPGYREHSYRIKTPTGTQKYNCVSRRRLDGSWGTSCK